MNKDIFLIYRVLNDRRIEIGKIEPWQDLDTSVVGVDVEIAGRVGHERVVDLVRVLIEIDRYGISTVETKPNNI